MLQDIEIIFHTAIEDFLTLFRLLVHKDLTLSIKEKWTIPY